MLSVSKCCCCFDLKKGFYTWGVLSLVLRITGIFMILYGDYIPAGRSDVNMILRSFMPLMGYIIATTVALFIALKGIMREKSMLIFPYIIVSIFDLVVAEFLYFVAAITISAMYFISFIVSGSFSTYVLICLISLHKQIREIEERKSQTKDLGFLQKV